MLVNMNISTLLDCFTHFDIRKDGYNFEVIFNKCIHPEFKYVKFWDKPQKKLKELKKEYDDHNKRLGELKLTSTHAVTLDLLREFFDGKLNEVLDVTNEIDRMILFNEKLKGKRAESVLESS